jgi:hypothetical protein
MNEWLEVGVVLEGQPISVGGLNPWECAWKTIQSTISTRYAFAIYGLPKVVVPLTFGNGRILEVECVLLI